MSYILDALRKSDQQRRHGMPPMLLGTHAPADAPRRRVSMSHIVLASVLVAAGVVIGSLRPWQVEQPAATTRATAAQTREASPPLSPASVDGRPQVVQDSARDLPAQETAPVARSATATTGRTAERQIPRVAKAETRGRTRPAPGESVKAPPEEKQQPVHGKAAGTKEATPERTTMAMSELPVPIQQELPSISFSVHAYSPEPRARMIGINDRVVREGEHVAPGLLLEEITPDGVIMTYKGYRFRRGAR